MLEDVSIYIAKSDRKKSIEGDVKFVGVLETLRFIDALFQNIRRP